MLTIQSSLLNTVLKVKNRKAVWVQNGCKHISCLPSGSRARLGAMVAALPSITRGYVPPVTSPGKEQNSKFEVQFLLNTYHFCTILKSRDLKSNHHKLGTVYIYLMSVSPTGAGHQVLLFTTEPRIPSTLLSRAEPALYWLDGKN